MLLAVSPCATKVRAKNQERYCKKAFVKRVRGSTGVVVSQDGYALSLLC